MAQRSNRKLWADYIAKQPTQAKVPQKQVILGAQFEGMILGIDPSLRGCGFAIINYKNGQAQLLDSITLKMKPKLPMVECLGQIANKVQDLLGRFEIKHVSIEQTIYVQNFQTAQIMGVARGAAIAPVAMKGLPVFEYAPLRIKQAIVGNGRASKAQVAKTVGAYLKVDFKEAFDESDASAVALCHAFTWRDTNE